MRILLHTIDMKRATSLILIAICLGLWISLTGCNDHPLKEVIYQHSFEDGISTGETSTSFGSATISGGTTDTGESTGFGTASGTSGDTSTGKTDIGPFCGNGIVEDGEQCDDGDQNGDFPAPCGPECFWNVS